MTTPAQNLRAGIDLISKALSGFYDAGINPAALHSLVDALADLESEHDNLPRDIHEHEITRCPDCRHHRRTVDRDSNGDRSFDVVHIECTTDDPRDCPAVIAAGFGRPEEYLPAFLRQAT